MNTHEKSMAAFTRLAKLVVQSHMRLESRSSYDYLGQLINNMQQINQSLMKVAIKIINKVKIEDREANVEQMITSLRDIIHGSVSEYAHRA